MASPSSPSWMTNYMSALQVRDNREKANQDLYTTYTKLANHTSALHASPPAPTSPTPPPPTSTPPPASSELTRLRASLASSHRQTSALQSQLSALTTQHAALAPLPSQLASLRADNAALARRLRDRDEELRGKAALVTRVQDDLVAAELQLNVAEEAKARLVRENGELVERWMARVGWEAEEVNRGNEESAGARRRGGR